MKTIFPISFLILISFSTYSQKVQLIPAVNNAEFLSGDFEINTRTTISFTASDSLKNEANYLKNLINASSNFKIILQPKGRVGNNIQLAINEEYLLKNKEAYQLTVSDD
ncbi:MAG: hypothetical protein ACI857_002968, partial [Arenicella sp.]